MTALPLAATSGGLKGCHPSQVCSGQPIFKHLLIDCEEEKENPKFSALVKLSQPYQTGRALVRGNPALYVGLSH